MRAISVLGVAVLLTLGTAQMWANEIALEGSDATAFHGTLAGNPAAQLYTSQLMGFLQGGSSKPVLVLGGITLLGTGGTNLDTAGTTVTAAGYSLAGLTLSDYSAIYVESAGGCCTQADTSISAADEAAIGAAEALGLNLGIENYGGGPAWGPMLPAAVDALPMADFQGITDYGPGGPPFCTDGEVFNANGLSKGFIQPAPLGCYEHQAYFHPDFAALGFISLVNSDIAYPFGLNGSAFEALGGALGTPVPEPASVVFLGTAMLVVAVGYKRRARRA